MADAPLVSVVFLSYNNARFIRRAIESALSQTYERFEVIAIDDCSSDESVSILESYGDDRIKIFRHAENLGLTPSYNEAIQRATGDFIINLDSDDAFSPTRTVRQLEAFASDARVDVVGTYVEIIDENDQPHARAPELEALLNQPWDFNAARTWIGQNNLARSSTMMHRRLHERVGPNELGMLRAPDYDLWTRALQTGGRFRMVPERLTQYRLHSRGLTYGDPKATFLELSYSLIRRLLPMLSDAGDQDGLNQAQQWMTSEPQFLALDAEAQARLATLFLCGWDDSFLCFEGIVGGSETASRDLSTAGRRLLQMAQGIKAKLEAASDAAKWHGQQAENWKAVLADEKARLSEAAAWLARQAENWKTAFEEAEQTAAWHMQQAKNWKAAFEGEKAWREQLQARLELADGKPADV